MKKLNNKGFTLIELLAVIVILAVVMGIAANSVITSMNKSRAGALSDTAQVIANGFNQKYTEALVDGTPSDVYGDVLGTGKGYNFSTTKVYYIAARLANTFNISSSTYTLTTMTAAPSALTATSSTTVSASFVAYNSTTGKFVVCMVANPTGSNFVDANKVTAATAFSALKTASTDSTYSAMKLAANQMVACSDGAKSW